MKSITFKNSTLSKLDSLSLNQIKIENINSKIENINISNSMTILTGTFYGNLNINKSSFIVLDSDFSLLTGSINLLNENTLKSEIHIYGLLKDLKDDIYINCHSNITSMLYISSSSHKIIYSCISREESKNKFIVEKIVTKDYTSSNLIPIDLRAPFTGSLKVNIDLDTIDFKNSSNIKLSIIPYTRINSYNNLSNSSLSGISGDIETINHLKTLVPNLKINGTYFMVNCVDGKGNLSLSDIDIGNTRLSVILNDKEYFINNY